MGNFGPMIDWQVFQMRAVFGKLRWLAVMRQSGLSLRSKEESLWHNLVVGLTENEERFPPSLIRALVTNEC